jgi:predicted MFS family arabinose efflux permease
MSPPAKTIRFYTVGPLLFVGLVSVFMVPFQIGALMDGLKLSAGVSSLLGTAELLAMSLTSILIAPVIGRIPLNWLALAGIALAVAGEIATACVSSLWVLSASRAVTGVGSGVALAAVTSSVALAPNPDRAMGLGLTLTSLLFFILFLITPQILAKLGYRGLFVILAVCLAAVSLTTRHLPQSSPSTDEPRSTNGSPGTRLDPARVAVLALGIFALNLGLGAQWSFAERIGRDIGLDAEQTGDVLSACTIAMIGGSATAGLMGDRFGYRWPLVIGSVACGIACYCTAASTDLVGYALGSLTYNFCYLMLGPFSIVGVPSTLDASGRLAAAAGGLMWLAYSIGVTAGGLIADSVSIKAIGILALAACFLAAAAFAWVTRSIASKKGQPTRSPVGQKERVLR